MFIIIPLAFTMGLTKAQKDLSV